MITKVQSWGNSQGICLNKQLLADAGINIGDEVDATIQDGSVVVTPVKKVRGKYDLKDLIEQVKSVDFSSRKAKRIGQAPIDILNDTLSKLDVCIDDQ